MAWFWDLNLIHFFDFYLAVAFLVSTAMRLRQYEAIVRLVRAVPERWPRLLKLVRQYHALFLTWATMLPAILAACLSLLHMLACRLIWPQANLAVSGLAHLQAAAAGTAFDRAYVAQQVAAHRRTLALVDTSIARAQNAALRTMLGKSPTGTPSSLSSYSGGPSV